VLSLEGRWDVATLVQEPTGGVEVPLVLQTRLPPERIQVSQAAGQPTLYTIALSGGDSLQAYVDPGESGRNTVHFTFFTGAGSEQPISAASATATPPAGATATLPLIRFDPGHFAANATLGPGAWRFAIVASTPEGTTFSAYFEPQIS